ncbi:MAG: exodeoxyribonuclease VII small subunit [Firmicutes bacterium]|nr:exodeoxyribonuclease VII small subunit [Bacteroidales bacterium]MCM1205226.1 exodeoxyribonuclease VII small subunit [Bacillota bacterium]
MKYEEAVASLEQIVARLESGRMDLDAVTAELKKAQQLIKFCKERLTETDGNILKILAEEQG